MTNFIYLLYGPGEDSYAEAAYSVATLRQCFNPVDSRIIIFTDQPDKVKDWPVICESVAGELAAMRGKKDFSHRAKLGAITKCFEKYSGNVFYLDSDTFIQGDIMRLAAKLAPGTAIMHQFECINPELGITGFYTELSGQREYRFSAASHMYNAGVIGLHRDNREVVQLALELCDAMLEFGGSRPHTTEQFAVSEALRISNIKILEARRQVTHYLGHRFYLRAKIREKSAKTGQPAWAFTNRVSYSYLKVYWLKKFGYYLE